MKLLFTTRNQLFSSIIRQITGEKISHVAIQLNDWLVIHSNLKGVHLETYSNFCKNNQIVYTLKATERYPKEKLQNAVISNEGKAYDFGALFYSGVVLLARRLFPWWTPKVNLWQTTGMFICTEFISQVVDNKEDSLITPEQLKKKLIESGKFNII